MTSSAIDSCTGDIQREVDPTEMTDSNYGHAFQQTSSSTTHFPLSPTAVCILNKPVILYHQQYSWSSLFCLHSRLLTSLTSPLKVEEIAVFTKKD